MPLRGIADFKLSAKKQMSDAPYTNEEIAKLGESAFPKRGTHCPRCRNFIPVFAAVPPKEEARLRDSGIRGLSELRRKTGCNAVFAKIWWSHPDGPHAPKITLPCPYCAEPLPTEKSKQCLRCGWDWHDPAKPVQHPVKNGPNQPVQRTGADARR
jgi:hypothetical protein